MNKTNKRKIERYKKIENLIQTGVLKKLLMALHKMGCLYDRR
jgi:hypothetical protein